MIFTTVFSEILYDALLLSLIMCRVQSLTFKCFLSTAFMYLINGGHFAFAQIVFNNSCPAVVIERNFNLGKVMYGKSKK